MIKNFVDNFNTNKRVLEEKFSKKHPDSYWDLVRTVVEIIGDGKSYWEPDPDRIHVIDDGGYRGTLVFVIGEKGYPPVEYWYVKVSYGSCSGCDTFESIRRSGVGPPALWQKNDYITLALHIVQGIKKMGDSAI